jgi:hypothetical protein
MDSALVAQLNRGYACPPDAGPAWRAAHDQGLDMSLIELSLAKTPWERLVEHDQALGFALQLRPAAKPHDGQA